MSTAVDHAGGAIYLQDLLIPCQFIYSSCFQDFRFFQLIHPVHKVPSPWRMRLRFFLIVKGVLGERLVKKYSTGRILYKQKTYSLVVWVPRSITPHFNLLLCYDGEADCLLWFWDFRNNNIFHMPLFFLEKYILRSVNEMLGCKIIKSVRFT